MADLIYIPWGKQMGRLVSYEDLKYRPLTECRMADAYISDDGKITTFSFDVTGGSVLIPYKELKEFAEDQKEKELGIELLKRKQITIKS